VEGGRSSGASHAPSPRSWGLPGGRTDRTTENATASRTAVQGCPVSAARRTRWEVRGRARNVAFLRKRASQPLELGGCQCQPGMGGRSEDDGSPAGPPCGEQRQAAGRRKTRRAPAEHHRKGPPVRTGCERLPSDLQRMAGCGVCASCLHRQKTLPAGRFAQHSTPRAQQAPG